MQSEPEKLSNDPRRLTARSDAEARHHADITDSPMRVRHSKMDGLDDLGRLRSIFGRSRNPGFYWILDDLDDLDDQFPLFPHLISFFRRLEDVVPMVCVSCSFGSFHVAPDAHVSIQCQTIPSPSFTFYKHG
jgi:hypothetical protein